MLENAYFGSTNILTCFYQIVGGVGIVVVDGGVVLVVDVVFVVVNVVLL